MKKILNLILMAAVLLCGSIAMTSCDGLVTAISDNPISPGLKVTTPSIQVEVGKTFKCNATATTRAKLVYTSADTSIATVDEYGVITGVKEGSTTITVTTEGKDSQAKAIFTIESVTIPVEVVNNKVDITSLELDETELEAVAGSESVKLTATVGPEDATDKTVTWESSDETVARVDKNGNVSFVSSGTATITATATNGTDETADDKKATCKVTVTGDIAYIKKSWSGSAVTSTPQVAEDGNYTVLTSSDEDVELANETTYVVTDDITINGNIKLASGTITHLILCDGKTLTLNGSIINMFDGGSVISILYVYAQSEDIETCGKLIATNDDDVIQSGQIEISGGYISAECTIDDDCYGGLYNVAVAMYGGKLTAKYTGSGSGYGIFERNRSIWVYDGELEATGKGPSYIYGGREYACGIHLSQYSLYVYGGKVLASNPDNKAISGKIMSGTANVKFYATDDTSNWGAGAVYDTETVVDENATLDKKYIKAE